MAARRGIAVVEVAPLLSGPAGRYQLLREGRPVPVGAGEPSGPEDVALVLHTSGTTSRPKIVPLTHGNLTASARNIGRTLALQPADRCLVVMPLFHIHGLIGALLSSMAASGSVYCPPGFNALKFFAWLDDSQATWYTAVPTMHQTILARAERNRDVIERLHHLRRQGGGGGADEAQPPAIDHIAVALGAGEDRLMHGRYRRVPALSLIHI